MDIDSWLEMVGRLCGMQNRGEICAQAKKRNGITRISPRCEKHDMSRMFASNIISLTEFQGRFRYLSDIYNMNSLKLQPSSVN